MRGCSHSFKDTLLLLLRRREANLAVPTYCCQPTLISAYIINKGSFSYLYHCHFLVGLPFGLGIIIGPKLNKHSNKDKKKQKGTATVSLMHSFQG